MTHNLSENDKRDFEQICISARMKFDEHVFMPHMHQKLVLEIDQGAEQNKIWESVSINNKVGKKDLPSSDIQIRSTIVNQWDNVRFCYPIDRLTNTAKIKAYVWNPGKTESQISDLELFLTKKIN